MTIRKYLRAIECILKKKYTIVALSIILGVIGGLNIFETYRVNKLSQKDKITHWLKKYNKYKGFTPPASNRKFWHSVKIKPEKKKPHQTLDIFNNIQEGTIQECFYATGKWLPIIKEDLNIALKIEISEGGKNKGKPKSVDISATSWAANMAHAVAMLEDQLPPELVKGIKAKVKNEVINPYLEALKYHQPTDKANETNGFTKQCGWLETEDNWVAVCLANIIYATLILEDDINKQALAIEGAIKHIENYYNSFDQDGQTRGGARYWAFGVRHYLLLAERLLHATNGNINLYQHQKIPQILAFRDKWRLKTKNSGLLYGYYPTFGDNKNPVRDEEMVNKIIAERTDSPHIVSPKKLWQTNRAWAMEPLTSASLVAGMLKLPKLTYPINKTKDYLGEESGTSLSFSTEEPPLLALATKGGNNNEEHNHNDMGSYTIFERVSQDTWSIVCGDQENHGYPKNYFGESRYNNPLVSSFGHPTPIINNTLQSTGIENKGSIVHYDTDPARTIIVYNLSSCYNLPTQSEILRLIYWNKESGSMVILDSAQSLAPNKLETGLILPTTLEINNSNGIEFTTQNNRYSIEVESSSIYKLDKQNISCLSWYNPIDESTKEVSRVGIVNLVTQKKSWIWYRISKAEEEKSQSKGPITIEENKGITEIPKQESIKTCLEILDNIQKINIDTP